MISPLLSLTHGTMPVFSPIDGAEIARAPEADPALMPEVIARATSAFRAWREVPAPRRGELVRLLGEELRAAKAFFDEIPTGKLDADLVDLTGRGADYTRALMAAAFGGHVDKHSKPDPRDRAQLRELPCVPRSAPGPVRRLTRVRSPPTNLISRSPSRDRRWLQERPRNSR